MDSPSTVSLSGQIALRQQLDVTANNLANANTTAFRGDRTLFQSHVSRLAVPGREIAFVQDRATYVDARQGAIAATGNPLDVAIEGEAYLAVERQGGSRGYTRDGRLKVGPDNTLMDSAGRPLLDEGGARILLPERAAAVEIRADGTILATIDGRVEQAGRIGLFRAGDMRGVRKGGDGLLELPAAEVRPVPPGTPGIRLAQGALEASTVQPVVELSNLTMVQRSYEAMQRIVSDDDARLRRMIEALGRPN
ncbi:flagellar biosynthesis protein FlgF [Pseudoroseomonas rhizosphaerae]|uniref:Flagellar biosynthesis protein FlgF n=1 Tax=Teichococcus rhizosphaerae TaxID=1335062 RepID=A0A2C7A5U5_9PROT|nr:flagellar hook basal-body protein [Pseudoroseomonas rhizosphaerae]PHK93710.1 flagellar biosynthesis protein FlgF [Pseudoroseomonas rhizosphaerae]